MKLIVDGVEHVLESPPLKSLLSVLREELGVTSPKAGCQQGGCGACTVLVNGEPRRSCLVPLVAADGRSITTVEGLGENGALSPVQAAFYEKYAAQCGFCTSGFILATHALLEREPNPSREQIVERLAGHLCRCTGYVKIVEAVEAAARGEVDTERIFPESLPEEPEVLMRGSPA
ncbi:MAG TPA: (2Fe-2S)-binding protein [Gaiellaceae bacterium]|nr:(2Fe-2S)-binding protein [Gaiellaceae bacterium]